MKRTEFLYLAVVAVGLILLAYTALRHRKTPWTTRVKGDILIISGMVVLSVFNLAPVADVVQVAGSIIGAALSLTGSLIAWRGHRAAS